MRCFGIWSSSDKWLTRSIIRQGSPLFWETATNNILAKIPTYLYRLPCSYFVTWDIGSLVPRERGEETPWGWGPGDSRIWVRYRSFTKAWSHISLGLVPGFPYTLRDLWFARNVLKIFLSSKLAFLHQNFQGNSVRMSFSPGDLIWAKMRGYPHWPARVSADKFVSLLSDHSSRKL